jgi:hypothetical protein
VADHGAENPTGDRNDDRGEDRRHGSAEANGSAKVGGQESRHAGCECRKIAGCDAYILRSDDAVDESNGEVETPGIAKDAG